MAGALRPIVFLGSSLAALRAFPADARRVAGFQLDRVQRGLDPIDWKPMASVGLGVREIRLREASGAYRVLYVTSVSGSIHVLHCFRKNAKKTSRLDLEIARVRYRALTRVRS